MTGRIYGEFTLPVTLIPNLHLQNIGSYPIRWCVNYTTAILEAFTLIITPNNSLSYWYAIERYHEAGVPAFNNDLPQSCFPDTAL